MKIGTHEDRGRGVRRSTPVLMALVMAGAVAAGPRAANEPEKKAEDPMKTVQTVTSPALPAVQVAAVAPESTPPAADADMGEFAGGLRVFKDPKTGRLREPEPEEIRALARKVAADRARAPRRVRAAQAPLTSVEAADGSVTLHLDESFMTEVVATKGPDGKIQIRHAGGGRPQGEDRNDQ